MDNWEESLRDRQRRWDEYFLSIAEAVSLKSKDPSTKIGAVVVDKNYTIRATGYNGFPRGVEDSDERLNDRETKYKIVVHGEMNAILAAARAGVALDGCTLYLHCPFGGPPCHRCAAEIIQSGIDCVISTPSKSTTRWGDSQELSIQLMKEGGVLYREVVTSGN